MKFSLALPAEAMSVPVIRRVLGDALRGLGVAEDCVDDILVAASEACTNVVRHSTTREYEVDGAIDDENCVLRVTDHGTGMGRRAPAGELAESGRGMDIMAALVDDLTLDAGPGGVSVALRKRLTWQDEALMRRLESELVHSAR
ncbi:ATP-binding protein [Actinocorallia sp. API 0066]|uniref:ATP-binding protein n=1 Tax=Actinocorallia sp. API 0066 TaxID=2896846 RepID=UPI001E2DB01F|nr:ATP-binding protein [Actinocorallia sp. API 0066]MCD0452366.1 ATP-binding protein [Actinocorallia sp. API 0066]